MNTLKTMKPLTQKEKDFLYRLLDVDYALQALDYDYDSCDKKSFKARHGLSFKQAEKIYNKLVATLAN